MNLLIIGNGFDLAHDLPTTYRDFLLFLNGVELANNLSYEELDKRLTDFKINKHVKEYIFSSYNMRSQSGQSGITNPLVQEINNYLADNVWWKFFYSILIGGQTRGNWVNFESEICEIVKYFDEQDYDTYTELSFMKEENRLKEKKPKKIGNFIEKFKNTLKQCSDDSNNGGEKIYLDDFIDKAYLDLNCLIRCLEIYLEDCVSKIKVEKKSPDIRALKFEEGSDFCLSFNYTHTLAQNYNKAKRLHFHYIHGETKATSNIDSNNMVLGVNEYRVGNDRDTHTNFNLFKKFVQRLLKETGTDYKLWLKFVQDSYREIMNRPNENPYNPETGHVYIFGHSLDVTDKDILKEIILTPGVYTTIFYRNKQQQADQIANLSKILGQDELLKRTFAYRPSIVFKIQQEMI